jgi:hypothetical protein
MATAAGQRQARIGLARQQFAGFRRFAFFRFFILGRMALRRRCSGRWRGWNVLGLIITAYWFPFVSTHFCAPSASI